MSEGVYPFCIIQTNTDPDFGFTKWEGNEIKLYPVRYKEIVMIVVNVHNQDFLPTRANLLAHQSVISFVMQQFTVVPMSFNNVFSSSEEIHLLLEKLYDELQSIFQKINNKIEVGLKVIARKEWLEEEIRMNGDIQKLKEKVNQQKEAAFYEKIKLGEKTKDFFYALHHNLYKAIYSPLSTLSSASKSNPPIYETMLLNAAFLIDREQEEIFDEKVNELYELWKDKVEFKYSGPWPAYNFIQLTITAGDRS
ncbi:gas vesicle protein GvpF [Bacillus sp. AFS077874]|uniref:GvpL/GvpF family gas vesicle protein n=1 Tax=unclassified Bacillus (in: firmicutes) TaxID=185979 RepID=UPI000BEDAE30|nr:MULTISPECIES: GvpL/GvpF family gas vesicle protein [unclassified Bacillus (in: firmicutes)]PEC50070.1 gas vesicle protein GvpF [Bacillus sp. AFS096315]PFM79257.1 gas vesicle protein GvpF [Bacillus sp. AFS077874]